MKRLLISTTALAVAFSGMTPFPVMAQDKAKCTTEAPCDDRAKKREARKEEKTNERARAKSDTSGSGNAAPADNNAARDDEAAKAARRAEKARADEAAAAATKAERDAAKAEADRAEQRAAEAAAAADRAAKEAAAAAALQGSGDDAANAAERAKDAAAAQTAIEADDAAAKAARTEEKADAARDAAKATRQVNDNGDQAPTAEETETLETVLGDRRDGKNGGNDKFVRPQSGDSDREPVGTTETVVSRDDARASNQEFRGRNNNGNDNNNNFGNGVNSGENQGNVLGVNSEGRDNQPNNNADGNNNNNGNNGNGNNNGNNNNDGNNNNGNGNNNNGNNNGNGNNGNNGNNNDRDRRRDGDSGLSDLQKFGLVALGALAVGAILRNGDRVAENTGDRVIVSRSDGSYYVLKDDDTLIRQPGSTVRTETFGDGSTRSFVTRADGSQIVTIRDASGRVLRRSVIDINGRETLLIDDLYDVQPINVSNLPRYPEVTLSASNDPAELEASLAVVRARQGDQGFSLQQVRDVREVRALAPRIEVSPIAFASGSSAIDAAEAEKLAELGGLISDLVKQRPNELFLIEGHTDAVGSAASNLALSDRRAESVALALTEYFGVPPENLVVQGYGEGDLLIPTDASEPANRRVAVRVITPLLAASQ